MKTITLTNSHVCAYTDAQERTYVLYTGGIAGISDRVDLQRNSEPLDGSPDEIQFEGQRVDGVEVGDVLVTQPER
jgi:hypothetical protein